MSSAEEDRNSVVVPPKNTAGEKGTCYFLVDGGDDEVIQISRSVYDAGGNVTESITLEANHDDTDGLDVSNDDDYIQSVVYSWYDDLGRPTATANYGACDSDGKWEYSTLTARPSSAPARSDTVLVTTYAYNSAGRMETVTDPRNIAAKTTYDDLGRVTHVANWGINEPTGWVWGSITEPIDWGEVTIPDEPEYSDTNTLVTRYQYGYDDEFGSYARVTDPAGIQSVSYADKLGRTTRTLESADAVNRVTLYAYDLAVEGKGYCQNTITAKNDA